MHAEDDHVVARHITQILPQPLHLLVRESQLVGTRLVAVRIVHILHRHDMHAAAVPRVVSRTESRLEGAAELYIYSAVMFVGSYRHERIVMVAHSLEYGHARQAVIHRPRHVLHHPHGIHTIRREGHIAQRHAVARQRRLRGRALHVGHGLTAEAADLAVILTLRIGQTEESELILGATLERRQRKVVTRAFIVQRRIERRIPRRNIDGILRRQ